MYTCAENSPVYLTAEIRELERMAAAAGDRPMPRLLVVAKTQPADAIARVAEALREGRVPHYLTFRRFG